jgi:hypothetical protein
MIAMMMLALRHCRRCRRDLPPEAFDWATIYCRECEADLKAAVAIGNEGLAPNQVRTISGQIITFEEPHGASRFAK